MAEKSPAKIKVEALSQVAIIVNNLEEVMQNYWNTLGIGPWATLIHGLPHTYDTTYHGKPAPMKSTIALIQVGDFGFELIQNLEGKSTYTDFLEKYGEGVHHLQYLVDSKEAVSEHIEILSQYGFANDTSARFGDNGAYAYVNALDTLKTIFEPIKFADEYKHEITMYPAEKPGGSPAKVKVGAISQVAIVVNNLEEVLQSYWNILGIGPWDVYEAKPPLLHNQTYLGKSADFTYRLAFCTVGPAKLELVQPVSGENAYSDFLAQHGERLHHIGFTVDNIDETTRLMNEAGFPTLMSASFGNGAFAYYDTTDTLKCIWEALQEPKKMPPPDKRYPA